MNGCGFIIFLLKNENKLFSFFKICLIAIVRTFGLTDTAPQSFHIQLRT